ncbi:MAG TPA: hypothetical protein VFT04_04430 [Gemmatimonadales bacterium]|nr:hypothetical protein [Gemmatimonadales bacterium]
MLLIREIFHCRPGKVRPMVEKFLEMGKLSEKAGWGKGRVMTDFSGDRYWTVISEFEVPSLQAFEEMMAGKGMTDEMNKEFERIMQGYHELVDHGHREIYRIEGV